MSFWDAYLRREVPRLAIRDLTHYSKYIISIIHHIQGNGGC